MDSILKNFRNPWGSDNDVLKTSVLDTNVFDNNILSKNVSKSQVNNKGKGTHFYDEEGNLIYKSKYGEGAAIIILEPSLIEDFKNNFGLNSNPVILPKEDDNLIAYYRKRYGKTYLINDMLQVYEKSKRDKRTVYEQYDENRELKIPAYLINDNDDFSKLVKIPVEVACPLSLNGYGEVIVGDYETELAIGNSPLHIYDIEVSKIKSSIPYYSVGFLHTEPVIGLKNISEKNGSGIYNCEILHPESKGPSGFDAKYYKPEEGYFSVIVRPNYIVFFRTTKDYFKISKKNLPT